MENKDAILPITYFPSIAYLKYLNELDSVIDIYENYQRRSERNKTTILGANGRLDLIVPLKKGKTKVNVKDVRIAYDENWVSQHLKTIRSAYGTSPYFEFYYPDISKLLKSRPVYLLELFTSITKFLNSRQILKKIRMSKSFVNPADYSGTDLRHLKKIEISYYQPYAQVFEEKYGFESNLSILDTMFNTGPETGWIIKGSKI